MEIKLTLKVEIMSSKYVIMTSCWAFISFSFIAEMGFMNPTAAV